MIYTDTPALLTLSICNLLNVSRGRKGIWLLMPSEKRIRAHGETRTVGILTVQLYCSTGECAAVHWDAGWKGFHLLRLMTSVYREIARLRRICALNILFQIIFYRYY